MKAFVLAAALAIVFARGGAAEPSPEAAATVVVYNRNDDASRDLARYYAGRRGIPEDQLVGLDCSKEEEISRDEYLVDIEAPLRATFTKNGWWKISRNARGERFVESSKIRFAALVRGVPMKVRSSDKTAPSTLYHDLQPGSPLDQIVRRNDASVDSELAAMFTLLEEAPGVLANPYYRRFVRIGSIPPAAAPLLVCRLDGPSDAIVRRMIDDAVATEERGLWGWAYIDSRSIRSGGYAEGDEWLTRTAELLRRKGIPVIFDAAPEVWSEGFPVTDAALYYGWYDQFTRGGPFRPAAFRFLPGAIVAHLFSYSAATIRTEASWAGLLLARGAAATFGNVYEPYLGLTINFDVLQDRLMNGFTLAEAAYAGTRGLSWMNVVIGDPLYRPYRSWSALESVEDPKNPWLRYRRIVLEAGGDPLAAAVDLRLLASQLGSSMPLEALGQAQAAAGRFDEALDTLAEATKMEKSRAVGFRIALEEIEILRRAGRTEAALKRIAGASGRYRSDAQQAALGEITLILRPPPPSPTPTAKSPR
jgi:uncharacterized protein (TIGR03790 family)